MNNILKNDVKVKTARIDAPIVLTPDQIALVAAAGGLVLGPTTLSGGISVAPGLSPSQGSISKFSK